MTKEEKDKRLKAFGSPPCYFGVWDSKDLGKCLAEAKDGARFIIKWNGTEWLKQGTEFVYVEVHREFVPVPNRFQGPVCEQCRGVMEFTLSVPHGAKGKGKIK